MGQSSEQQESPGDRSPTIHVVGPLQMEVTLLRRQEA